MKKLLGGLALSALLAAPAIAADIPMRPAPVRTPAAAPVAVSYVYNWTGCHIGINGGFGFGTVHGDDGVTTESLDGFNGGLAGGQFGCTFQTGGLVIGAEVDGQWSNLNRSEIFFNTTIEYGLNWFGTARGIFGFAANNVLFYATGGYAHLGFRAEAGGLSESESRGGWTAGGGVKYGMGNWAVKLEYLYLRSFTDTTFGVDTHFDAHIGRAGIEFRFGGGGPIASRY